MSWWRYIAILVFGCASFGTAVGQAIVEGHVRSAGTAVPFANIGVQGTTHGTAADSGGEYRLSGLAPGTYTIAASAVGYRTSERTVSIDSDERLEIDFELQETVIESEGIVVTGTLIETSVKDSPVKVDVVSGRHLGKTPTSNVMDAINRINGLREQIDCGVCGTNNIRINGMDGPYTVVLIDGMPIMSSLATVYGLNGISPALIQQIEVIKGPMSTLYGTEALAGVINIITKSPRTTPRSSVNAFATHHGEYNVDIGVVPSRGDLSGFLSGTFAYNERYLDGNNDEFADLPLNKRASLFAKLVSVDDDGRRRLRLSGRYYYEDRIGGTHGFLDAYSPGLRGSPELYGEAIRTERAELMGDYHILPGGGLRFEFAANEHRQDSFYGDERYHARQATAFGQLLWQRNISERQTLLAGAALRLQQYDDNTGSTGTFDGNGTLLVNQPDNRLIPGVFAQHEAVISPAFRALAGVRFDYQQDHGFIFSPRLSLKASPSSFTTARLNGGTGFRIVNLFTEDHAAYTGARATVLLEDLRPERSYSATASLQHILPMGDNPLTLDLDGFYTYFTNKIEPDYSTPGEIRYQNLDGNATTRGVSASVSQNLAMTAVTYQISITAMDVFRMERGTRTPIEFAPIYQGSGTLTLSPATHWSLDYTFTATGPMKMPEYGALHPRPSHSPAYMVHNIQATREIHLDGFGEVQLYGAVMNLLDYIQPSPLIDPANPFGDAFDTTYVYGPIRGRNFGFGARLIVL